MEIGDAVKGLSPDLTATEPEVDWSGAASMRDCLAHHTSRPGVAQVAVCLFSRAVPRSHLKVRDTIGRSDTW